MIEQGGLARRECERGGNGRMKGCGKGRGWVRKREREMGLAVCGVNGRSARLTNIKMCTGDAGVTRLAR